MDVLVQPSRLKASGKFEVVTRAVVSDDGGEGKGGRAGAGGGRAAQLENCSGF